MQTFVWGWEGLHCVDTSAPQYMLTLFQKMTHQWEFLYGNLCIATLCYAFHDVHCVEYTLCTLCTFRYTLCTFRYTLSTQCTFRCTRQQFSSRLLQWHDCRGNIGANAVWLTSNWPLDWQPGLKLSEPWFPPLIPPSLPFPPSSSSFCYEFVHCLEPFKNCKPSNLISLCIIFRFRFWWFFFLFGSKERSL